MGMRADLFRKMSPAIRMLVYNDSYYCRDVETRKYDRYISDNPDNVKALEDAMTNKGITLVVAATGSGKTRTLTDVAKKVVKQDKDCKVYIVRLRQITDFCTWSVMTSIRSSIFTMQTG